MNLVVMNALAANAANEISPPQFDDHAHSFARFELNKVAAMMRKAYNDIFNRWQRTSVAVGYKKQGHTDKEIEDALSEYMMRLDSAINDVEGL